MEGTVKIKVEDFKILLKAQEEHKILKDQIRLYEQAIQKERIEIAQDLFQILERCTFAHNPLEIASAYNNISYIEKIFTFKQLKKIVFKLEGNTVTTIAPKALENK